MRMNCRRLPAADAYLAALPAPPFRLGFIRAGFADDFGGPRRIAEHDPCRRMIARVLCAAYLTVDPGNRQGASRLCGFSSR